MQTTWPAVDLWTYRKRRASGQRKCLCCLATVQSESSCVTFCVFDEPNRPFWSHRKSSIFHSLLFTHDQWQLWNCYKQHHRWCCSTEGGHGSIHSRADIQYIQCFHITVLLFPQPVVSQHGLLTTVAYKLGKEQPACYALEVCTRTWPASLERLEGCWRLICLLELFDYL